MDSNIYVLQMREQEGLNFIRERHKNNMEQFMQTVVYEGNNFYIMNSEHLFEKVSRSELEGYLNDADEQTLYKPNNTKEEQNNLTYWSNENEVDHSKDIHKNH